MYRILYINPICYVQNTLYKSFIIIHSKNKVLDFSCLSFSIRCIIYIFVTGGGGCRGEISKSTFNMQNTKGRRIFEIIILVVHSSMKYKIFTTQNWRFNE